MRRVMVCAFEVAPVLPKITLPNRRLFGESVRVLATGVMVEVGVAKRVALAVAVNVAVAVRVAVRVNVVVGVSVAVLVGVAVLVAVGVGDVADVDGTAVGVGIGPPVAESTKAPRPWVPANVTPLRFCSISKTGTAGMTPRLNGTQVCPRLVL